MHLCVGELSLCVLLFQRYHLKPEPLACGAHVVSGNFGSLPWHFSKRLGMAALDIALVPRYVTYVQRITYEVTLLVLGAHALSCPIATPFWLLVLCA